jgi:hypothetical protein
MSCQEQLGLFWIRVDGCADLRSGSPQNGRYYEHSNRGLIVRWQRRTDTKWSRQSLLRLSRDYNQWYWGGRLPEALIVCARLFDESGEFYGMAAGRTLILIDPALHKNSADIRETLLHEMVHIAVGGGHGKRFLREIERLMREGAPISFRHVLRYARYTRRFNPGNVRDFAEREDDYREFLRPPRNLVPVPGGKTGIDECFCSKFCNVFKAERSSIFCAWALEDWFGLLASPWLGNLAP